MPWRMGIRVVEVFIQTIALTAAQFSGKSIIITLTIQAWLVARLLSSPSFHRAVRRVHGRLTGTKHLDEEVSNLDTGHSGTDLEGPRHNKVVSFLKIYFDELKNEFKRK